VQPPGAFVRRPATVSGLALPAALFAATLLLIAVHGALAIQLWYGL